MLKRQKRESRTEKIKPFNNSYFIFLGNKERRKKNISFLSLSLTIEI